VLLELFDADDPEDVDDLVVIAGVAGERISVYTGTY